MIRCKQEKVNKIARKKNAVFVHHCDFGRKDDCYESLEKNGMYGPCGVFLICGWHSGCCGTEHPLWGGRSPGNRNCTDGKSLGLERLDRMVNISGTVKKVTLYNNAEKVDTFDVTSKYPATLSNGITDGIYTVQYSSRPS